MFSISFGLENQSQDSDTFSSMVASRVFFYVADVLYYKILYSDGLNAM